MVNIQSSCPMLMKKFSSLHQKVPNNAKESLRHRIKSYKLQLHLYIRNLQTVSYTHLTLPTTERV